MSGFLRLATTVAISALCALPAAAKPPNIVLILADDLGFSDLAPYGSEIHTPTLSALAAEGLRFSNYHTAASCAPTRGMLLTGVDSHRNGVPNIVEAIPPEQLAHAHYQGSLNHNVVTIATLLKDAGYHTYMAGKWHLGMAPDELPIQRGFERSVAMADTGADNFEQKPYLPIYEKANWFEDGEELTLPEDFYSSKYFIDKTIEFIDADQGDGRPFFSYIPFQAVHIPVQVPQEFTDKYMGRYDRGWEVLRENRLKGAVREGILSQEFPMDTIPTTKDWDSLSAEEKRYNSKRMAVYAGMIEAMDHHLGRLIDHLKETGQYEDTLFLFASDNGAESSDPIRAGGLAGAYFKLWMPTNGYNDDYDTLGTRGSFSTIGASFASSAAAPLAYYKFFSREGGMRVPLIVTGVPVAKKGGVSDALVWVTDLAPTVLDLAGVAAPDGNHAGKKVERMQGRSLLPLLRGEIEHVHGAEEPIGYELAGNAALFRGDHKIVLDRGPIGDGEWHLFDITTDPGETNDLRAVQPERFETLLAEYRGYAEANGVLPVPDGYDQRAEVARYGIRKRLNPTYVGAAGIALAVAVFFGVRGILARLRG